MVGKVLIPGILLKLLMIAVSMPSEKNLVGPADGLFLLGLCSRNF